MKVVFRADASSTIGTGHIMRCLSLAQSLKNLGNEITFVCRELPGNLCDAIDAQGFAMLRLKECENEETFVYENEPMYASWLGTSWQLDASETYSLLEPLSPLDWLVVDHYALDARWETACRSLTKNLMAIDDLFDRSHDVDVLLNQNILPGDEKCYDGMLPSSCRQYLGPRYALLQDQYQELRNRTPHRSGTIEHILVYFGGVDEANLTGRSLEALLVADCSNLKIDVVLPLAGPHRKSVCSLAARMPAVKIHDNLPSLANLMVKADLGIGAGGATSWERLCLGLPTLIVTLSENQVPIAKSLQANNLARWLGHHDEISTEDLADALRPLLQGGLAPGWSDRCRATVDGAGANRISALLALGESSQLNARHATIDDDFLVMDWRLLSGSASSVSYNKMLRSIGDDRLYMVEVAPGEIVGSVRCSLKDGFYQLKTRVLPRAGAMYPVHRLQEATVKQLFSETQEVKLASDLIASGKNILISICTDKDSWINDFIPDWALHWRAAGYNFAWGSDPSALPESQICFYLGYSRIVGKELRSRHGINLVVHESDLPAGRGWSPLTWQVLGGANKIMVTLFEAVDEVDAGMIYGQTSMEMQGDELVDDLRQQQASSSFSLCSEFVAGYPGNLDKNHSQHGTPSYFARRTPADSQIDIDQPVRAQFNLLRVCDNQRYPAWFEIDGAHYKINISRLAKSNNEK